MLYSTGVNVLGSLFGTLVEIAAIYLFACSGISIPPFFACSMPLLTQPLYIKFTTNLTCWFFIGFLGAGQDFFIFPRNSIYIFFEEILRMSKHMVRVMVGILLIFLAFPGLAYGENSDTNTLFPAGKTIVYTIGSSSYLVDGQVYEMKGSAIIVDAHTMVPILDLANPLGASLKWDAEQEKATFDLHGNSVEMIVGSSHALINGVDTQIDSSYPLIPSHLQVYVPLSVIATNLGAQVSWDASGQQVTVICP